VLRASIERLAAAASSPRVKYLVTYSAADRGAVASSRPSGIVAHTVELTGDDVEQGLLANLEDPSIKPADRVRLLTVLAGFSLARKDSAGARARSAKALEESRALGSPAEEAVAWMSVGGVLFHDRELGPARDAFAFATARAVEGKNPILAAEALLQVGHTHFLREEHAEAGDCYRAAADHFARIGHVAGQAQALVWLGESHRRREQWADAYKALHAAIERLEAAPESMGEIARAGKIEAMERLARMYDEAGMKGEARALRAEARALGSEGKIHDLI
jgi:tetratricopeptide (TPR) repeat protein